MGYYVDPNRSPNAHATSHTDGTDDIQDATSIQKGVATASQITKLDGIETGADVTDFANVNAALAAANATIDVNTRHIVNASRIGVATANPGVDVAGGTVDLSGDLIHVKSNSSAAGMVLEGNSGTNIDLIDLGGAGDDKWARLNADGGVVKLFSLTDAGSTRTPNIFVVDIGNGNIGIGTASPPSSGGDPCMFFADAGSNPATIGTNTAGIFAKDVTGTVEFFAMDEGAAATQLTQHAKDAPDAAYFDPVNGKGIEWLSRREIPWKGLDGTAYGRAGESLDGVVYWQRPGEPTKWVESFAEYNARLKPKVPLKPRDWKEEVSEASEIYTKEYTDWESKIKEQTARNKRLPRRFRKAVNVGNRPEKQTLRNPYK